MIHLGGRRPRMNRLSEHQSLRTMEIQSTGEVRSSVRNKARRALPVVWTCNKPWTLELDGILEEGVRHGQAGEYKAVQRIRSLHREFPEAFIWNRVRFLRNTIRMSMTEVALYER